MQTTETNIEPTKTQLAYSGICNDQITVRLIEIFSQNNNPKLTRTTQKRIPYLIAECFQNIIRHGANLQDTKHLGEHECFEVELSENELSIISTNLITNSEVESLIAQLKLINSSSQEELKSMRFEIISTGTLSDKGGAGLGLIELARKSENTILHSIKKLDAEYSIVTFSIKMDLNENNSKRSRITLSNHKPKCLKDAVLFYKGHFGKKIKNQIQYILSENLKELDESRSLNWLDKVALMFGNTEINSTDQGVVELLFKKIMENIDFEAKKKYLLSQVEEIKNLVTKLNLERYFSIQPLTTTHGMAVIKLSS